MNLLFGGVLAPHDIGSAVSAARITNAYASSPNIQLAQGGRAFLGWITDGGSILGTAERGGLLLAHIGYFARNLPEWKSPVSPVSNPIAVAEYLLERFMRLGAAFLHGVQGQFAVAILDRQTGRLTLATDNEGHRNLFVRQRTDAMQFSSQLASLHCMTEEPIPLDRSMEDFLLGFEFLPDGKTPLADVKKLAKGGVSEFHGVTGMRTGFTPVERMAPESISMGASATDSLHDAFMCALADQCPDRNRVAVMLGGFDSALIASALAKMGKEVETFTFRFNVPGFTQHHVDTLQAWLGHRHTWVDINPGVIANGLSSFGQCFNQPVGQMHYLMQTMEACRLVRESGFDHCFTGDGCDEVFLGYPTVHARAAFFQRIGVVPAWLTKPLCAVLGLSRVEDALGHVARFARNVLTIASRSMPSRGFISSRVFDAWSLNRLRIGANPAQTGPVEAILQVLASEAGSVSATRLAYLGKSSVGLNKVKVEGCTAWTGVSLYSPFQHPRVASIAKALPEKFLRPEGILGANNLGKHCLMRMAEHKKMLPPEIIYQPKASPVRAPVDRWYLNELREPILSTIRSLEFPVDDHYVDELLRPRWAEDLFRRYIGLGYYASHAASLLATYGLVTRSPLPTAKT